jgi:hypothetical protein
MIVYPSATLVPDDGIKAVLSKLFANARGVGIGESHTHRSPIAMLIDHLDHL